MVLDVMDGVAMRPADAVAAAAMTAAAAAAVLVDVDGEQMVTSSESDMELFRCDMPVADSPTKWPSLLTLVVRAATAAADDVACEGVTPEAKLVSELKSMSGAYGCNLTGSWSGSSKLRTRNTTKCMAVQNSANDNAPSLVTSDSCLKVNVKHWIHIKQKHAKNVESVEDKPLQILLQIWPEKVEFQNSSNYVCRYIKEQPKILFFNLLK